MYEDMIEEGWELTQPVQDDYGFIARVSHAPVLCI